MLSRSAGAHENHGVVVEGRVVDAKTGAPVPYVDVHLEGDSESAEWALSDEDGRFALPRVPLGRVVLVVEGGGIATHRQLLFVVWGGAPIVLAVEVTGGEGNVVVVRAPFAPLSPASTTRVTAMEAAATPLRTAEDILRLVPGLTLVQHGSEGKGLQFFLRGFDAQHGSDLAIYVDGLPANEWSNVHATGYVDLAWVIPEVVNRVDVTKGPFLLEQGPFAMAGSADYRLGVPLLDLGWRASYELGTTNRHRLALTYSPDRGDGDSFVAVEALHDSGFGERRTTDRAVMLGRWRVLDDEPGAGTLDAGVAAMASAFELPTPLKAADVDASRVGLFDSYAVPPGGQGRSLRGWLWLDYAANPAGHSIRARGFAGIRSLLLRENFTGFLIRPDAGDWRRQSHHAWSYGVDLAHRAELLEWLSLRWGVGFRGDTLEQSEEWLDLAGEPDEKRRGLDATQWLPYGYAGVGFSPFSALRVDAGVRFDVAIVRADDTLAGGGASTDASSALSPRVTARWSAFPDGALYASYGRGVRPPEARAFTSFAAEQEGMEAERAGGGAAMTQADAFELGVRWEPESWLGVTASGFATLIERESVFDHVSGLNLELNGTRRLGGELVVQSRPVPWLLVQGDVSVVDARFSASENPVPFLPPVVGGVRAVLTHPNGLRAGLRVSAFAPRPLPYGAKGASYASVDASAGWHGDHVRIDMSVENLLDLRLRQGEYNFASDWQLDGERSLIPSQHVSPGPPLNARIRISALF